MSTEEPAISTTTTRRPTSDHPSRAPATSSPGERRALRSLAVAEGRRLTRHPAVLLGALLSLAVTWSTGWFTREVANLDWADQGVGMILSPLLVGTLFAAWLLATRDARHGTEELAEVAPLDRADVTRAHALALLGPLAVSVVVTILWLVELLVVFDGYGTPDLGQLVHGPALVGLGGALGLAIGTWTPFRVAPLLALVAFALPLTFAENLGGIREFAWWRSPQTWVPHELRWAPVLEHTAWIVGLALVLLALAVLRHGVTVRRATALLTATAVALAGGWAQAQGPSDADLGQRLAFLADPPYTCLDRELVTYCVLPGHEPLVGRWHDVIDGVSEVLPDGRLQPFEVRVQASRLSSGVLDALGARGVEGRPGAPPPAGLSPVVTEHLDALMTASPFDEVAATDAILVEPSWARGEQVEGDSYLLGREAAVRWLGFAVEPPLVEHEATSHDVTDWARGLRTWPGRDDGAPMPAEGDTYPAPGRCTTEGQARAALAVWAAGAGTDAARNLVTAMADPSTHPREIGGPWAWILALPEAPGVGGVAVGLGRGFRQWTWDSLDLGAQLLAVPTEQVRNVLAEDWQRWTDPASTVDELVAEFDLRPPLSPAQRLDAAGVPVAEAEAEGLAFTAEGELDPSSVPSHSDLPPCT